MLHYIIQTIAFQLFFLLIYDVILKKETFFNWNRIYLIVTAILSILIPFIKINGFKNVLPKQYVINLPEVIIGNAPSNETLVTLDTVTIQASKSILTWENILYLGIILATCIFIFKIVKICRLILKNPKYKIDNILIVNLLNSNAAFSFFRYIFLGERINETDKASILKHETIHVKQKHTLDLLFFEILRILFWFNPLVYMYQNRIMVLHEFIADQEAVKHQDKSHYYQNLLSQVFETNKISFINPFFHQSLIKKRIVMLQKSKSKQIHLFKYALLIPLVFGMLVYTSSYGQEKNKSEEQEIIAQPSTSVEVKKFDTNKDYSNEIEVPYAVIEEVPIFPGCDDLASNEDKKQCTSNKITEFVIKNFNTELATNLGLEGRQRINVLFKIDAEGNIVGVQSRAPHPSLEAEANRVISLFPKMTPGKQRGKKVIVPYSLPILFIVEGTQEQLKTPSPPPVVNEEIIEVSKKQVYLDEIVVVGYKGITSNEVEVPFAVVEQVPVFPGCENLPSNIEKRKCMSDKITEFVSKKFNTDLASDLGLSGRQRINVLFKIDKTGNIVGVQARAPHAGLEKEAARVVSMLPKMQSGKQRGNLVVVPYALPIIFQVQDDKPELEKK